MNNSKTIVIITKDNTLADIINRTLSDTYSVSFFQNIQSSFDFIYNSMANLLILDINPDDTLTNNLLKGMKSDPIFCQLPVLAVVDENSAPPEWQHLPIEDYIWKSTLEKEILIKANLCILRSERVVDINPLTRLPGNVTIIKQIQQRLDNNEVFALAYTDVDHFKPFNDKYGFSRGDEILKMLGRLILNNVKEAQPHSSFVGHIGGDDFVFIMDVNLIEDTAKTIISYFDKIVPTFYDAEDKIKGYIESTDREGNKKAFPIVTLSIGIAHNKYRKFSHYGEMAEVASEMKKYAKTFKESSYTIDLRKTTDEST
jgi:diguanylate cyclase (GGDEF)-like protein